MQDGDGQLNRHIIYNIITKHNFTVSSMSFNRGIKILIVDDEKSERELFSHALSETGVRCTVQQSVNGRAALDLLGSAGISLPDIVFLDLNMPVMDGRETLEMIKTRWKALPVFIFSTASSPEEVTACYSAGANLFLVKPSDFSELVHMLRSFLELFSFAIAKPELNG
jgi:CheY-like chemotaxis protein